MTRREYFGFILPAICFLLIVFNLTSGQTGKPAPPTAESKKNHTQAAENEPVLILHNLCDERHGATNSAQLCQKVITRGEFDSLAAALDPKMPDSNRLNLASEYARLLVLAQEARRLKLDQEPQFKELEAFTRLQLLERQLVRALDRAAVVSREEVEQYYRQHATDYEEGRLRKLSIPKTGRLEEAAQVEEVRKRAEKGEDFDSLQSEIYRWAGGVGKPATTKIGPIRRSLLPSTEQTIFDLNRGEVSAALSDASGYYIYKLESKNTVPLEAVEAEIRGKLESQRLQDRIRELRQAVMISVNEDYFGNLPNTEDLAKHHGMEHQGSHLMPMSKAEKQHP